MEKGPRRDEFTFEICHGNTFNFWLDDRVRHVMKEFSRFYCASHLFGICLEVTVDWYLANTPWLKNVTSGTYRSYYQAHYVN
jgi:hypothetical protein